MKSLYNDTRLWPSFIYDFCYFQLTVVFLRADYNTTGIFFSDDDGNINPYATFKEMKQAIQDKNSEMDDISLEKAEAQRAVCISQ